MGHPSGHANMVLSHEQEKDFAAPRCDEHAADVV